MVISARAGVCPLAPSRDRVVELLDEGFRRGMWGVYILGEWPGSILRSSVGLVWVGVAGISSGSMIPLLLPEAHGVLTSSRGLIDFPLLFASRFVSPCKYHNTDEI